ncbi:MAG: hypothetical protein E7052_04900 [Lentisphaerae bacterium]|nr:hypothetical protein [Lentisphaerota bacterium]
MKKILIAASMFAAFPLLINAAEVVEGRVIKYPLNVRAGAGMKYTAVAQLTKDNPVRIIAVGSEWLEIAAPENSRVWVLARLVKNGKLAANVNLRSGPGTGYEAVGLGRRGTAVKVHGQATASGWLQIDALKNTTFYVGRPAIEVDSNALKKLPKLGGKRPLPNQDLITLEGNFISDGKTVRRSGYLYESEDNIKTITHVLYQVKGDELAPEYFVVPHREKLTGFNGKKVNVMGEEYKVKNWDMPVLVVKRIVESK